MKVIPVFAFSEKFFKEIFFGKVIGCISVYGMDGRGWTDYF